MSSTAVAVSEMRPQGLVAKFASKFGVEPAKMLETLKATAFKQTDNVEISNAQMMALLVVADQHNLSPWTREIFAYPDRKGIVAVVSVDGWSRILNDNPNLDGVEFIDSPDMVKHQGKDVPTWIECVIYRKDRSHPTRVRERFAEVMRDTQPWKSHPSRMLRHKVLIQCARVAFGFSGIYDEDEAHRIVAVQEPTPAKERAKSAAAALTGAPVEHAEEAEFVDVETGEVTKVEPQA